jgi:hypothetical protein
MVTLVFLNNCVVEWIFGPGTILHRIMFHKVSRNKILLKPVSQNHLPWQIWVGFSCLPSLCTFPCSSRHKWHNHYYMSLIKVIGACLLDHQDSPGTVFSTRVLRLAHGMIFIFEQRVNCCVEKSGHL